MEEVKQPRRTVQFCKRYRSGRLTRNPFLNFLRVYRRKHYGLLTSITKAAGREWRRMTHREKLPYMKQAARTPYRRRTRNKCRSRYRSGKRCECSKRKKKKDRSSKCRNKRSYSIIEQSIGDENAKQCACKKNNAEKMKERSKTPGRFVKQEEPETKPCENDQALYSKRSFLYDDRGNYRYTSCSDVSD